MGKKKISARLSGVLRSLVIGLALLWTAGFAACGGDSNKASVPAPDPASSLELDRDKASVEVGTTMTLSVSAKTAAGADDTITVSCDNAEVAEVTATGLSIEIKGLKSGRANITVQSGSNRSAVCNIAAVSVYYAGTSYPNSNFGLIRNGEFTEYEFPKTMTSLGTQSLLVRNGDVYIASTYSFTAQLYGGVYRYVAGYFKNGVWTDLTVTPASGTLYDMRVTGVEVSGGNIFAIGSYSTQNPTSSGYIYGYWINGSWTPLSSPTVVATETKDLYRFSPADIKVSGSSVYIGGQYDAGNSGSYSSYSGYWKDNIWNNVNAGSMLGMDVSDNSVYLFGRYGDHVGSPAYVSKDNSVMYLQLNSIYQFDSTGHPKSMSIENGNVYVSGECAGYGYWKNGVFTLLGTSSTFSSIGKIFAVNDDVYVFGSKNSGEPGYWKNGVWNAMTIPAGETSFNVVDSLVTAE